MNFLKKFYLFILFLLLSATLSGCGSHPIVGKWIGKIDTLRFYSTGGVRIGSPYLPEGISESKGRYKIVGNDRIIMDINNDKAEWQIKFSQDQNTLELTRNGKNYIYTRTEKGIAEEQNTAYIFLAVVCLLPLLIIGGLYALIRLAVKHGTKDSAR